MCLLERHVSINVMFTVSTRRVTEPMAAVCMVVKMDTNVLMVCLRFWMNFRTIIFLNNVYDVEFFIISFLDTTTIRLSLSENLPAIVGGTVGACVPVIIGIVLVLFVIRYVQINKSYNDSISLILQLI